MKNKLLGRVLLFMVLCATGLFAATDPIEAFNITFTELYTNHLSKVIVLGVVLFSAYEFYKTKQFTFLIIGAIIAIIVVGAPDIASTGAVMWEDNFSTAINATPAP
ncbi:MAG: hypothetical protein KKE17_15775 [Proteobacteria bacterium]|nr:hypothetical protein [Pseudomonadota bacterium]MBU1901892.1 hypothetical protein [Patescibacteria group bacterium]